MALAAAGAVAFPLAGVANGDSDDSSGGGGGSSQSSDNTAWPPTDVSWPPTSGTDFPSNGADDDSGTLTVPILMPNGRWAPPADGPDEH